MRSLNGNYIAIQNMDSSLIKMPRFALKMLQIVDFAPHATGEPRTLPQTSLYRTLVAMVGTGEDYFVPPLGWARPWWEGVGWQILRH
jgi:hypothetical protein